MADWRTTGTGYNAGRTTFSQAHDLPGLVEDALLPCLHKEPRAIDK
jgi:hypothetical protein